MSAPVSAAPGRVSLATLAAYGLGEVTITVSMVVFGLFVLFFYTTVMLLPATLAGLASAAGLAWDAAIDPYIGHRSDRHAGALGRRHGFMLAGGLVTGVTLFLLLSPPRGLGTGALFAWLLATTVLCRTAGAVFRIPYLSLGAELSRDYHERTAVAGARALFGLAGTLGAATLSFAVFFPNRAAGVDPKLDYAGYPRMGLAFGVAMTVAAVLSTIGTLRHRAAGRATRMRVPFASGLRTALRNRAFRGIWWCVTLFYMAVVVNAALGIHYFTHYVRITDSDVLARLQLSFYLGALAGVFPWVKLSQRIEKRKLSLVSLLATAALMALATVLFGEGSLFGTGNPAPLLAGHFLAGACASALWVLPASMMADLADEDELTSGQRREGLFFGMVSLGEKMGAGAALLLAGILLDVFVGFVPGQPVEGGTATRLGVAYGLVPGLVAAVAAVALARYPLDRVRVTQIQAELQRRQEPALAPGA